MSETQAVVPTVLTSTLRDIHLEKVRIVKRLAECNQLLAQQEGIVAPAPDTDNDTR